MYISVYNIYIHTLFLNIYIYTYYRQFTEIHPAKVVRNSDVLQEGWLIWLTHQSYQCNFHWHHATLPRHLDSAMALPLQLKELLLLTDSNRWHSLCCDRFSLRILRTPTSWRVSQWEGTLSHEPWATIWSIRASSSQLNIQHLVCAAWQLSTMNIHGFMPIFLAFAHIWRVSSWASKWLCKQTGQAFQAIVVAAITCHVSHR